MLAGNAGFDRETELVQILPRSRRPSVFSRESRPMRLRTLVFAANAWLFKIAHSPGLYLSRSAVHALQIAYQSTTKSLEKRFSKSRPPVYSMAGLVGQNAPGGHPIPGGRVYGNTEKSMGNDRALGLLFRVSWLSGGRRGGGFADD